MVQQVGLTLTEIEDCSKLDFKRVNPKIYLFEGFSELILPDMHSNWGSHLIPVVNRGNNLGNVLRKIAEGTPGFDVDRWENFGSKLETDIDKRRINNTDSRLVRLDDGRGYSFIMPSIVYLNHK